MSDKTGAWIQRIPRDEKTKDADFFQTPYCCTYALLDYLKSYGVPKTASMLDPCTGDGAISKVLKTYFSNVTEIDKYSLDVSTDFLTYEPGSKYDMIIMNPPFVYKKEFIDKAMKIADVVVTLLPCLSENYIVISEKYKDVPEYAGKVTCYPKMFFDQNLRQDGTMRQGGTTNYTWLIYKPFMDNGAVKFEVMKDVRKYYKESKELVLSGTH